MGKSIFLSACLLLSYGTPVMSADPFTGKFLGNHEGTEYRLVLTAAGIHRYEGEIVIGGQRFALSARRFGEHLAGGAANADTRFAFTAEPGAGGLLLHDDSGRRISFRRHNPGDAEDG